MSPLRALRQSQSVTDIVTERDSGKTCATCAFWMETMPDSPGWGLCVSFAGEHGKPPEITSVFTQESMDCPRHIQRSPR